jgi:hypothetical protein
MSGAKVRLYEIGKMGTFSTSWKSHTNLFGREVVGKEWLRWRSSDCVDIIDGWSGERSGRR